MTETATRTESAVESLTPAELNAQIDDGEEVSILDVRSGDDFDEWHIAGENVEIVNHPYFELLDTIPEDVLADVPEDRTITVLCAKGDSSEMIAEMIDSEGYDVNHLEGGMKGWARIYEYTELDVEGTTTVAQYRRPSRGCLAYLVASNGEAALIDPLRAFTDQYIQDIRMLGVTLEYALDTHIHADHISGIRELAVETGATVALPELAAARGVDYDVDYEPVDDGEILSVGDVEIEVIHTPGHTTGMTAYKIGEVLFTGDGLFTESVARPDLEDPEAATTAARTLYNSLQERVLTLSENTVVAPAHFSDSATPNDDGTYTARLGDLIERMDALTMDEDEFIEFVVADMPPQPANYEDIIATNRGQTTPDDDRAFELELGPNNCAASDEALTN